jgi:hypothetical protein
MMNVDQIIADVRLEARFPESSTESITDDELLSSINRVFSRYIVPFVLRAREEFWVYHVDMPLVDGKRAYAIPYRSIGSKVRDVFLVKSDTNDNESPLMLGRVEPENIPYYAQANRLGFTRNFYIENTDVVLLPIPSNMDYDLRMKFFMRPSKLVTASRTAVITAIDTVANKLSFAAIPDAMITLTAFDTVCKNTPHKIYDFDMVGSVSGTDILFTDLSLAVANGLTVGDYVTVPGESSVPMLPHEMVEVLIQRSVEFILKAQGDREGAAAIAAERPELERDASTLADNRIHGKNHKVVNMNSPLRRIARISRRGF